ncbi:hypothetical protein CR513_30348, partial [Mucuna pruriens]
MENVVVDALSRRHILLPMLETKLLGFESLKDLYMDEFKDTYDDCAISSNEEAHDRGLMGHLSVCKTYEALVEHFYWPKMKSLYTPLPLPTTPWIDISIEFVLGMPRTLKGRDSIFIVVEKFSKMAYFIPYHKRDDAYHVVDLFFRKVIRLDEILKSIGGQLNYIPLILRASIWVHPSISFGFDTTTYTIQSQPRRPV